MFQGIRNWLVALGEEMFFTTRGSLACPGIDKWTCRGLALAIVMAAVLCFMQVTLLRTANFLTACGLRAILVVDNKGAPGYFAFAAGIWALLLYVESRMRLRAKHVPVIALLVYLVGSGCGGVPQAALNWAGFHVPYPTIPAFPWRSPAMQAADVVLWVLMIMAYCRWFGTGTWLSVLGGRETPDATHGSPAAG